MIVFEIRVIDDVDGSLTAPQTFVGSVPRVGDWWSPGGAGGHSRKVTAVDWEASTYRPVRGDEVLELRSYRPVVFLGAP